MSIWDRPGLWEAVQKDWADGLTLTQIAKRHVGLTRNAVGGRLHRQGVMKGNRSAPTREAVMAVNRITKRRAPTQVKTATPKAVHSKRDRADQIAAERAAREKAVLIRAGEIKVDSPNARPFLDAPRFDACKWPIGEGLTMLSCCNALHRGSYCEGHSAIAYSGAVGRRPSGASVNTPSAIEVRASWFTRFERIDHRSRVTDRKLSDRPLTTPWDEARAA